MNSTLLQISQMKDDMTKKERSVAEALLRDPQAVVSRSITEYAQYISSSTATITRFCKRIGLSGFSELRLSISKNPNKEIREVGDISGRIDLNKLDSTSEIIDGVVSNAISSINRLYEIIPADNIDHAASQIIKSRRVLLCGVGASSLVARDLHQKLVRLGIPSHIEDDLDVAKVLLTSFGKNDTVIAFSYSGCKTEIKNIVKLAKSKGAVVVAVTRSVSTPIGQLSDIHLPVAPTEAFVREGATVSRLQMLLVVDMLFQVLINRGNGVLATLLETWNSVSGNIGEEE